MTAGPPTAAFFDIGDTLAVVTVSADGRRIESLAVLPSVPGVLRDLRDRGVRLGIISNRGAVPAEDVNRALDGAGILRLFEPDLVIYGRKDTPGIFDWAAAVAGKPATLLFVGENAAERENAERAGFRTASRPMLALEAVERP